MDFTEQLMQYVSTLGVVTGAVPDAVNRGKQHFGERETPLTPQELQDWGTQLKAQAQHLFPVTALPDLSHLSPQERLTRARAQLPPPARRVRPVDQPVELTAQEMAALAQMHPTARATAYRAMQEAQR